MKNIKVGKMADRKKVDMSCSYPVKKTKDLEQIRNDITDLALEWRMNYCDLSDEDEAYGEQICDCHVCELLRKCDEYIEMCNKVYKDEI